MGTASNPKRSAFTKEHCCSICGRIFDSAETLDSHKRMDHGQGGGQPPAGVGERWYMGPTHLLNGRLNAKVAPLPSALFSAHIFPP